MNAEQTLNEEKIAFTDRFIYIETFFKKQINKSNSSSGIFYFLIKGLTSQTQKKHTYKALSIEKNSLHIEVSTKKIHDLLAQGQLCAADIHCLDDHSKQCLKKLCLKTCLHRTSLSKTSIKHTDNCKQ